MADSEEAGLAPVGGDRRGGDRRTGDRRRVDRRAPPPLWRRPSAFVAYGVLGALTFVLLVQALTPESEPQAATIANDAAATGMTGTSALPPVDPASVREAYSVADFETLIAEGDRAVGQVVRADLFCGSIASRQVRDIAGVNPALQQLADADGRVGGAECQWGREGRTAEILLVVPPALAAEFASAPEEEINFLRRRRVGAQLEWLGRSEALSLRYAGVLRDIVQ